MRYFLNGGGSWFSSDEVAHNVLEDPEIVEIISSHLHLDCSEQVAGKPCINRKRLRELVFNDAGARKKLESIVHPQVFRHLEEQQQKAKESMSELFLAEVPLHYESIGTVEADLIIVVASSRAMQTRRLMERRGLDYTIIEGILRSQWPIEAKVKKADIVIWNDGDISALEAQALTLAGQFSLA